mgnify:CR=1 FL=1
MASHASAGRLFAAKYGRGPTEDEWKKRWEKGSFEGVDESGLDALPGYDALLKMDTLDAAGLSGAMKRLLAAYAPLRADSARLLAAGREAPLDVAPVPYLPFSRSYRKGKV